MVLKIRYLRIRIQDEQADAAFAHLLEELSISRSAVFNLNSGRCAQKMRREEYIVVFTTQLILDNYCILYLLITLTCWQPFTTQCPLALAQLFTAR